MLLGLRTRTHRILSFTLLACVAVSLVCVVYPIYVIRPFRAQGARELVVALDIARIRPAVTVLSALIAIAAMVAYWRERVPLWRRGLASFAVILACALVFLGRVNIYEQMFHPIDTASFSGAGQAKLDQDEKVIAVKLGQAARAYPVRSISYHHIVNDTVDGRAIVATY